MTKQPYVVIMGDNVMIKVRVLTFQCDIKTYHSDCI